MLALVLIALSAETLPCSPEGPIMCTAGAPAFFEFAPTSGAGMGTACACTTPTGAKGETLTFTRASSATCLKTVGTAPQAIANGDLVTCTSGQARVMPGSDGTSVNGLLIEEARTNGLLRSEELSNIAWTNQNGTAAAPVVTADQAVAPDGTTTADRAVYPATTGGAFSFTFQSAVCGAGAFTDSIFVKGNASSGSLQMRVTDGTANTIVNCAYVSTAWTRCSGTVTATVSPCYLEIGGLAGNGGTTTTANDVFVWGMQQESGAFASSYIKTISAAATRVAESPTMPLPAGIVNTAGSAAATFISPGTQFGILHQTSTTPRYLYANGALLTNDGTQVATVAATLPGTLRAASSWSASTMTVFNITAGTSGSAAFDGDMMAGTTSLILGVNVSGVGYLDGVLKQVCLDPNPSRCR